MVIRLVLLRNDCYHGSFQKRCLKTFPWGKTDMYPIQAEKKLRAWIRSRNLICSGNFYLFETVESSAVDRFTECVETLGGSIINVEPVRKLWIGKRRVFLMRVKASLHTPEHALRNYWSKYGSFYSRFDERG